MRRGFSDSYQVTRACACARELMRMQARARACEQVSMRMHRAYACARTRARMLRALLSSAYVVISRWSSVLSPEKISTVPRQQQKQLREHTATKKRPGGLSGACGGNGITPHGENCHALRLWPPSARSHASCGPFQ